MPFPEQGRQAAHVLIDAVVAADVDAPEASNLAYQRLLEVKAFTVNVVDDGGDLDVTVDMSDLLGATLITIGWLAEELAKCDGRSKEQILFQLREYVDTDF